MSPQDERERQGILATQALDILRQHIDLVASGRPLDESLAQLAAGACRLAGCPPDLGLIRVFDPLANARRQDVRSTGAVTRSAPLMTLHQGVIGRALVQGREQIVLDVSRDKDYIGVQPTVRSEIALPLLAGAKCWGVLNVESPELGHFSPRMVPVLLTLASQAALTVQHAILQEQTNRLLVADILGTIPEHLHAALTSIVQEARDTLTQSGVGRVSVEVAALSADRSSLVSLAFATANPYAWLPGSYAPDATVAWQVVSSRQLKEYADLALTNLKTTVGDSLSAAALPIENAEGDIMGVMTFEAPAAGALDNLHSLFDRYRARAEATLQRSSSDTPTAGLPLASIVAEIGRRITQIEDPATVNVIFEQVLRQICQMIDVPGVKAAIGLRIRDELTFVPERTFNYTPHMRRPWSWPIVETPTGWAVSQKRSVLIKNVHELGPGHYIEQDPSADCELAVPLLHGDDALGVIDIIAPSIGSLTPRDQSFVEALAGLIVQALDRVDALKRRRAMQLRIELIRETNEQGIEEVLRAPNPRAIREVRNEVLRRLLRGAMAYTDSRFGAIMEAVSVPGSHRAAMGREPTELVLVVAQDGEADCATGDHYVVTRGILGEVCGTRRSVRVGDLDQHPNLACWLNLAARSEMAVPIVSGDRLLGILDLQDLKPWLYSPEQSAEVELLSSQAASVLSAAHLMTQRVQLEQLTELEGEVIIESLYGEGSQISDQVKRRILRTALELTEQPDGYASLWLHSGGRLYLDLYQTVRADDFIAGSTDHACPGIVARVFETRQPIMALNVEDSEWRDVVTRNWGHTQAELAVPLLDRTRPEGRPGHVLGVLNVESRRVLDFTEHDLDILELLAQTMVAAMQSRQLYSGKITLLRDLTHAVNKITYPLRQSVAELRRPPYDATQPGFNEASYLNKTAEITTLSDMVSSLFDWFQQLVRFEDKVRRAEVRSVSANAVIEQMVERMRPFAHDQEKEVSWQHLSPDAAAMCSVDLVKAALFLLIENALRYGPAHDTVTVKAQRAEQMVRIEVVDHGNAIPDDDRNFLFESGFRGRESTDSGSGIGLVHVRRIIEQAHAGHVGYQRLADGNAFFIDLPLDNSSAGEVST